MVERYPSGELLGRYQESDNVAIKLYGRRFHKDQTPVEYLAEFLLVFTSAKVSKVENEFSFNLPSGPAVYWPKGHMPLKLFTFFPTSKLETRHPVHQQSYIQAIEQLRHQIEGSGIDKEDAITLLQSLFSGFVGVSKNRTWVTHSFLPATSELLAREIDWKHSEAVRNPIRVWDDTTEYFATDRHNFMARGGEVLFLQLSNLFSQPFMHIPMCERKEYKHLQERSIPDLKERIEVKLKQELTSSAPALDALGRFIETTLSEYDFDGSNKQSHLGWAPAESLPEAFLFACEIDNIIGSSLGTLEKFELMRQLCCLHVLRSLCFQAKRYDLNENITPGFVGNYAWIVSDISAPRIDPTRMLAQKSLLQIEGMLFRVLRIMANGTQAGHEQLNEADKHGFHIFRKVAKEIELVVPRKGQGARFALTPQLLRLLVATLLSPNEKVRLTEFYDRAFAHYGIALGERQLATALRWGSPEYQSNDYAVAAQTAWVEEALRQGGLLVELSDAVSIVHNPS
jgi:hypothetical protein